MSVARKKKPDPPRLVRSQPRDPVTGQRRSIYASSETERDRRLKRLDEVRRDLKWGLDPAEAARIARPALGRVLTVDDVWTRYVSGKPAPSKKKAMGTWEAYIRPYLGGRRAWELSPEVLEAWILDLGKSRGRTGHGLAPGTIWLCYDYLAAAFNRLVPRELSDLPWGRWRPALPRGEDARQTRREYATTPEQLAALVMAARARDVKLWNRGLFGDLTARVVVLLLTGLRQAEGCALAWDNVAIDAGVPLLHVWAQAPQHWRDNYPGHSRPPAIPKGRRRRKQIMHPNVIHALTAQREQLDQRGWYRADGPCFPGRVGAWRTSGQLVKPDMMRALATEAGLPNPHLWVTHSTRHTFATLEVAASLGDFKATKKRTGHASIAQLELYYHAATGRGLPESQIPGLPPDLLAPALEPPQSPPEPVAELPPAPAPELPAPPLPTPTPSAPEPPQEAAPEACPATYLEHARAWLEACSTGQVPTGKNRRPLSRPLAVTEDIRRAQRRIYSRARAAGWSDETRTKKMAQSRRGKLAAWSRALATARRDRAR